jgi:histidine ammonia-lyase
MTRKVIDNSFDVLTIQTLALVQAIDYLKCQTRLSTFTHKLYEEVRQVVGTIVDDQPRYNDIQAMRKYLITLGSTVTLSI